MNGTQMVGRVGEFLRRQRLLSKGERYLLALSGGADSVAMLLVIRELGFHVEAVHCNFRLRGGESDRDEDFCVQLCLRLGVTLHRVHFDTREYARLHGVSIEMAARHLRYHHFAQLAADLGASAVLVAHHRDDSVETLLMNLMRGTGVAGLAGIHARSELVTAHGKLLVLRPMLCVGRADIEAFLKTQGQDYVTDSTNLQPEAAVRNAVRLRLLPLMEELNPSVRQNIFSTVEHVQQAMPVVNSALATSAEECREREAEQPALASFCIKKLLLQPSPEYTLLYILSKYGFTAQQVEQIFNNLNAPTGTLFVSETHELLINRGHLLVANVEVKQPSPVRLPETGIYVLPDAKLSVSSFEIVGSAVASVSRSPMVATLDADTVRFPLTMRRVQKGDRFRPYGMSGSKLVSDYLTDRRRSLFHKRRQWVLTDASGNILWLVGERVAADHAITEATRRCLRIEYNGCGGANG